MQLPPFLDALPRAEVPFPEDVVTARAMRTDRALVVIFTFHKDMDLPPHAHGAQWGTVLEGSIDFTIGGDRRTYRPGEGYSIPAGATHSARIPAGTVVIDFFEEPDRYAILG
jgi:quercetin dioxygenase-like cupin family protein